MIVDPLDGIAPDGQRRTPDRFQIVVALLHEIRDRLDGLEQDVDAIDRTLRPYGDGAKVRRLRPHRGRAA